MSMNVVFQNGNVLCEVPKKDDKKASDQTVVVRMDKTVDLVPFRVAESVKFPDSKWAYPAGLIVYVRSDQLVQRWATNKVKFKGKEFILVPFNEVVATEVVTEVE